MQAYSEQWPQFAQKMDELFPGAFTQADFLAKMTQHLQNNNFQKGSAVPMVSVCRDELTFSLLEDMEHFWGPLFNMGSIGGMVFCGKTGLDAGMHHTTLEGGQEQYIFLCAPHIAISAEGEVGKCFRPGRSEISSACGALCAFHGELQAGTMAIETDTHDAEQTLMKQQLLSQLKFGEVPTLEDLTKEAQKLMKRQVIATVQGMNVSVPHAFISGVQVHGPENTHFFWMTDFAIYSAAGEPPAEVDAPTLAEVNADDLLQSLTGSNAEDPDKPFKPWQLLFLKKKMKLMVLKKLLKSLDPSEREDYANNQPTFMAKLQECFPGAMPEMDVLTKVTKCLRDAGFEQENTIPMISVCRDGLTDDFVTGVESLWGPPFNMGSIAGMVFTGKTGLKAGMHHAPVGEDGTEKYIFFAAPHVAISGDGEVGPCVRPGNAEASPVCGALGAFLTELQEKKLDVTANYQDLEYTTMKKQLIKQIPYGDLPSLVDLTKVAQQVIKQQLEGILPSLVHNAQYAFVSGVQIHGPNEANFFCLTDLYVVNIDQARVETDPSTLAEVNAEDVVAELTSLAE